MIIFTKKGFEELKDKLEKLKNERPTAVLDLKKAREMGDLSENGYYKAAKFKLNDIDRNIRRNSYLIKNAKVVVPDNTDRIGIGSKILVEVNGNTKEYLIVGEYEANPQEGKISYLSPVGSGLMNKTVNEKVVIKLENRGITYKVLKILVF
jgi:transcription elongation factor GreA